MTDGKLTAGQEIPVRVQCAALCSLGKPAICRWMSSGTEDEITAAAMQHADENPGHKVTCQVKQTRTWSILRPDPKPETTENDR